MKYTTPETKSLKVNAQSFICTSPGPAPAPGRSGELGTMEVFNAHWW